ncbi:esterase family protein [Skermania sp. ID1734]|uniref:alpha/beta hydrolase n=1 Tax=Skermania sp. ID1734 TaxID=2597516 RepID=UPI00117FE5ED|nr:alpha/beta hydrolase family protein [Skermania sp. ID1734]TSE02164.1 esterase family protein [Skermania sp. ID1734]
MTSARLRKAAARLASVATLAVLAFPVLATGAASADPVFDKNDVLAKVTAPDGSYISQTYTFQNAAFAQNRGLAIFVHSTAMNLDIPVEVQRPDDVSAPRPVLYLLNGGGGGEDGATWQLRTDVMKFLGDKKVNVVTPIGGKFSYYTDWQSPDPVLGVNKWKTFLTEELPPIINAALGTNGKNAIAGLSTSGTTVLQLPEQAPGLYQSAAAYSGCAQMSDPLGQTAVRATIDLWSKGGNSDNMYGPPGDPLWAENDPVLHADKLRGVALYISSGNGVPGKYDVMNGPYMQPGVAGYAAQTGLGGGIESVTDYCSHNLQQRLNALNIPATFHFPPYGTHSWGYWQDELKNSWPVLSAPLGI